MPGLSLSLFTIPGIPLVNADDDIATIILNSMGQSGLELEDNDIIVVAQKIISKAEGRIIDLNSITPGEEAVRIAKEADKDPRQVELILQESNEVIRCKPGVIIVEHRTGIVMANAGIDHSNVSDSQDGEFVCLLPEDANVSADRLRKDLQRQSNKRLGVIINDSVGRAWRVGTVGLAIGSSGVMPLRDLRGEKDLFGHILKVSETADADALASSACILMGEADDSSPVVIIRGYKLYQGSENSSSLVRSSQDDMFR